MINPFFFQKKIFKKCAKVRMYENRINMNECSFSIPNNVPYTVKIIRIQSLKLQAGQTIKTALLLNRLEA